MLLTGAALVGGTWALGTTACRIRRPKPTLVAALRPSDVAQYERAPKRPFLAVTPRTMALGTLAAGGSALLLAAANGYTPVILAQRLATLLRASRYGPLLYVAIDTVRPLTFFPDMFLTFTSGLIFGPVLGLAVVLVGNTTSALVAYHIGRSLRSAPNVSLEQDRLADPAAYDHANDEENEHSTHPQLIRGLLIRYGAQMQRQPFASMLLLHGMMLYFDAVNCLAGYLGLGLRPFLAGVLLGSLPATVASVFAGASFHSSLLSGVLRLNPLMLATSGVMVVGSLGVARYLHERDDSSSAA